MQHRPLGNSGATQPRPARSLTELAEEHGRGWAISVVDQFVAEARNATGGWPGTVSEARARVHGVMRAWEIARSMEPWADLTGAKRVSAAELDDLAQALYRSARVAWLARCARDVED